MSDVQSDGYLSFLYSTGKDAYVRSTRAAKSNKVLAITLSPSVDFLERIGEKLLIESYINDLIEKLDSGINLTLAFAREKTNTVSQKLGEWSVIPDTLLAMVGLELISRNRTRICVIKREKEELMKRMQEIENSKKGMESELMLIRKEVREQVSKEMKLKSENRDLNVTLVAVQKNKTILVNECEELRVQLKQSLIVHQKDAELAELFASMKREWEGREDKYKQKIVDLEKEIRINEEKAEQLTGTVTNLLAQREISAIGKGTPSKRNRNKKPRRSSIENSSCAVPNIL
mmetsp:Transcript_1570/g.2386  ORF Transcript_1570/g.2386 Transcript_1570/m.2386 type:complete len:289 (-) Transcript_1570:284-1150(-)|eukprot:CAMPEP_0204830358 /NCGR_PEP_ID=MMETSP1346-20131115/8489_1 /ASSEMBLY_ACC=CAM_ASM_000771 /TAXON_ID=215587 /ORGANISM="Aplanochytrium stocchinoi, Strain GSBS06" /LENGTH=288 /DNA_ID=CAMNT_0051960543 /DNA_START=150 /DNA_END=1016 /DNA_ORIENTATION=-